MRTTADEEEKTSTTDGSRVCKVNQLSADGFIDSSAEHNYWWHWPRTTDDGTGTTLTTNDTYNRTTVDGTHNRMSVDGTQTTTTANSDSVQTLIYYLLSLGTKCKKVKLQT